MRITVAFFKLTLRYAFSGLLLFVLSSCGLFEEGTHTVKAKHIALKSHYQVNDYIEHISLAYLVLANNISDNTAAAPHLVVIEDYTAQKQKKAILKSIVILSYTVKGKVETQRIIAPFSAASTDETANNSALLAIMNEMDLLHYTLHDVRPAFLSIAPVSPIKFKNMDAKQIKALIEQQQQAWLKKLQPLSLQKETQAQIKLTRFFIDHHMRDAAYLSVENAKQALAVSAEYGADPQHEKDISQQLAQLESQLREAMPFTFMGVLK